MAMFHKPTHSSTVEENLHARVREPYYLLPLRDAHETAALLDLLLTTQSEVLRPVLHRLLQYAKEVRDAGSR
jgi:hypothetical protein